MDTRNKSPIERAAELAGGAPKLADACGVSFQAVYKWIKKGYPPVERCEAIETAVHGQVTRFDLLPPNFSPVDISPRRRKSDRPAIEPSLAVEGK